MERLIMFSRVAFGLRWGMAVLEASPPYSVHFLTGRRLEF